MKKNFLALAIALLSVGFTSCNLSTTKYDPLPKELILFADSRFSQSAFSNMVNEAIVFTNLQVNNSSGTISPDGVTLNAISEGGVLKSLAITYNMENRGYKGVLNVFYQGKPFEEGSTMRIVPSSFTNADFTITGDVLVTFRAKGDVKYHYDMAIEGGNIKGDMSQSLNFSCMLTCKQKEGNDATSVADDTFGYTGSFSGTYVNGTQYTSTISDELVFGTGNSIYMIGNKAYYYISGLAKSGKLSQKPLSYDKPFYIEFGKGKYLNEVLFTFGEINKYYLI